MKRPVPATGVWFDSYDAEVLAAANWLLVTDQMPEMLPPAPMNSAAEARATKAISNVYSIKS